MRVETFLFGMFMLVPVLALWLVMLENRLDRREGLPGDAPTFFYVPGALLSVVLLVAWASTAVLHADVPFGDPCELLEPYSWKWILLGCLWGS